MKTLNLPVVALVGDRVYIPELECHAHVRGLRVTLFGVDYLVAWFHEGKREEEFLMGTQLAPPRDGQEGNGFDAR